MCYNVIYFVVSLLNCMCMHMYAHSPLQHSACLAVHVLARLAVHFGVENGKES